ncbi:MAG: LytTR family DNA-binding domain-containing protein [Bacteroidales bacterium]|nr:LytTR family DNA-binding domain-containing protein [Bacteroidales bacterium]
MKIYIAEDEPLAAAKLKLFLEKLNEQGDISIFDNGISALAAIDRERPDLLFLDIQMPGMTGMEIMQRISGIPVIVTSAYDNYAIDSFSFNATDYLLKPYTLERLKVAVEKARKAIRLNQLEKESMGAQLTIRCDGKNEVLNEHDILWLESLKDYVRIVTSDGKHHLTLGALSSFEQQLDTETFARVHRSFIINLSKVKSSGAQMVTMSDGTEIPIGRKYKSNTIIQ